VHRVLVLLALQSVSARWASVSVPAMVTGWAYQVLVMAPGQVYRVLASLVLVPELLLWHSQNRP